VRKIPKKFRRPLGILLMIIGILGIVLPLVPFITLFPLGLEIAGFTHFSKKIK